MSDEPGDDGPTDVLVLKEDVHGMPSTDYADALRERLPGARVAVARTPAERRAMVPGVPVVTGLTVADWIDAADDLELFACMYAGADHLPLEDLEALGVAVTNASGVHAPNVAEHAVGGLLASLRRFHVARRRAARGEWRHYRARELAGSTVCVVGQGAIGTAIVDRLGGFDVETVAVRHTPKKGGPADRVVGYDDRLSAFADADHLVLACPLTETTQGLVDAEALRSLGAGSVLVNVARGPVVDTDALVTALRDERVTAAVLDVTDPEPLPADHPLWNLKNVLVTPHSAGHTPEYYERLADIVAENVTRLRTDEDLRNRVR